MRIHGTLTEVNNLKTYSLVLGLLTCWLITHPYLGIIHDAIYYTIYALSRLYPEAYKNDIFILYKFQDNYTIFTPLYSFAISCLGLSKAAITLTLLGQALWLSASFFLARILLKGDSFWLFLALLFTLPGNYGYEGILSYGEPFLTPRIISEALTICSIAFFIQRRLSLSIIILIVALFTHPLIAGIGLIFLLIYSQQLKLQSILIKLLIIISILFVLAVVGVGPFSNLFRVMDEHWYQLVFLRDNYIFVGDWDIKAINQVVFDCSIILSVIITTSGQQRRVLVSALVTGTSCLMFSWFGADVLHNVFIIQVQLWRALWLTHWFAYLSIALLIVNWNKSSNVYRNIILIYITAWFSLNHVGGILSLIGLILCYFNQSYKKDFIVSKIITVSAYLPPVVSAIFWLIMKTQDITVSLSNNDKLPFGAFVILFLLETRVFITIAFLSFWKLMVRLKNKLSTVIILLFMLLIFSIIIQARDMRSEWMKFRENSQFLTEHPFRNKIPIESLVYWQDSVESTWLILGRSSYASYRQASPILFAREMALKLEYRLKRLKALGGKDSILSRKERSYVDWTPARPTRKGLVHVCHDPELDFVVLSSKFPEGLIDEYYDKEKDIYYYLYDCKHLRENFQDTWKRITD
jgi:hypothetical protein